MERGKNEDQSLQSSGRIATGSPSRDMPSLECGAPVTSLVRQRPGAAFVDWTRCRKAGQAAADHSADRCTPLQREARCQRWTSTGGSRAFYPQCIFDKLPLRL